MVLSSCYTPHVFGTEEQRSRGTVKNARLEASRAPHQHWRYDGNSRARGHCHRDSNVWQRSALQFYRALGHAWPGRYPTIMDQVRNLARNVP